MAECLLNPFGEDDEDVDVNALVDRNLQVSHNIITNNAIKPQQITQKNMKIIMDNVTIIIVNINYG